MKIGVSTYSFKSYTGGNQPIEDVIRIAKEIGYEQIEFIEFRLPDGECPVEHAKKVKACCEKTGIGISAYTCGADFLNGGRSGDPAEELKRMKLCADVAATLGAKKMRHDSVGGNIKMTYMQAVDKITPIVRELTAYAEQKGVKTMAENHGYFLQDSYRIEYFISKIDHPNFGALIDIGNFICADEDPIQAVGRLANVAFHVHAKDFYYRQSNGAAPLEGWGATRCGNSFAGTIVGRGDMPVKQCLRILKKYGYDEGLGLEFEGREDNMEALTEGYQYLKKTLAEI